MIFQFIKKINNNTYLGGGCGSSSIPIIPPPEE